MKLEIGSGNNPTNGFEHLDVNPNAPHVEYVGDIRALITKDYDINFYPDFQQLHTAQFEGIRCIHVLEHIQWIYQNTFLRLLHDLLEPGGILYLETPDLKWIMMSYSKNRKKKRFPTTEHPELKDDKDLLQFYQWVNFKLYSGCSPGDFHHCCYDKDFLTHVLLLTGFESISIKTRGGTLSGIVRKPKSVDNKDDEFFKP